MKKKLKTMLTICLTSGFALFLGCSTESDLDEQVCGCERVTYIEAKYQQQGTGTWLLNYTETEREPVDCQEETNYSVPPTGSQLREVHRIECN